MTITEIILSQRNKPMLRHRLYLYHHHSYNRQQTRRYWRCYDREVCDVRIVTNTDEQNIIVHKDKTGDHLHPPNVIHGHVKKIIQRVRAKAQRRPNEKPARIIREETRNVRNPEILVNLPNRNALQRLVNYHQNKQRPPIPRSLQDIVIEERYRKTLTNKDFLLHDSGEEDDARILIFSTEDNIRILSNSDTIYSDGTFKTVPEQFLQLFTMHGRVMNGEVFPLVYVLTARKTEETYQRIYTALSDLATSYEIELNPIFSVVDFEKANINAIQTIFPGVSIICCLFHFSQSLYRQVVIKGLREAYLNVEEPTVRDSILTFFGLPFVPLQDVAEVFELVVENAHVDVLEFADYIEVTYVKGRPRRGRRRAIPPTFPPNLWNVHDLVLNGRQRTNNIVEGWNSKFQKMVVSHHVNIWRFIENLQEDQHDNETLITQIYGGHTNVKAPINKKYMMNQEKVERIVRNYAQYKQENNLLTYLRAVAYHLKLHANPHRDGPEQAPAPAPAGE